MKLVIENNTELNEEIALRSVLKIIKMGKSDGKYRESTYFYVDGVQYTLVTSEKSDTFTIIKN
jgi:hypothetical protein